MSSASAASSMRRRMKASSRPRSRCTAAAICRSPLTASLIVAASISCQERRSGGRRYCAVSATALRRRYGERSGAPRDGAGDDAAARQSAQVELPGVAREIREAGPACLPGLEQPLEGTEEGTPLELGVQCVYLVAPVRAVGEREEVIHRILAAEVLTPDELVEGRERRRQLRHPDGAACAEGQKRRAAAGVRGVEESQLLLERRNMGVHLPARGSA